MAEPAGAAPADEADQTLLVENSSGSGGSGAYIEGPPTLAEEGRSRAAIGEPMAPPPLPPPVKEAAPLLVAAAPRGRPLS